MIVPVTYYVYCLIDPTDGKRRYVGHTKNPKQRLKRYKGCGRVSNLALYQWLLRLKIDGLEPQMEILEELDNYHKSLELEQEWMKRGLAENWGILNAMVGGKYRLIDPFTLEEIG